MFDIVTRSSDYLLRWPRELFVLEAKAILAVTPSRGGSTRRSEWTDSVTLLLDEAFVADTPRDDFDNLLVSSTGGFGSSTVQDPWGTLGAPTSPSKQADPEQGFLKELIDAAPKLAEQHAPKPYYSQRTAESPRALHAVERDIAAAQRAWRTAVRDLQARGYLVAVAPEPCEDDGPPYVAPDLALDAILEERLGKEALWSSPAATWDEDTFYDLIEVFHDLVSRPRRRWYHNWDNCGWHWKGFTPRPAQILYRWMVNRLLERHGISLRLAKSGEDVGRLVREVDDTRIALVDAALATPDPARKASVAHAVALFRNRSSGVEEKRSACFVLAGLLEERRDLLKEELLSADEGALFLIANKFAIRHRRADQQGNYDPAYLEWLFWWYIATIELTDKLLATRAGNTPVS
ncbi:hypothetical protein [Nocardia asteroides]|uniref:hypothetical protein n=1 Tax=Nocardia asteroides TaxID=1824 RepID=UPI0033EA499A